MNNSIHFSSFQMYKFKKIQIKISNGNILGLDHCGNENTSVILQACFMYTSYIHILMQYNLQELQLNYNNTQLHITKRTKKKLQKNNQLLTFTSKSLSLCLQVLNISLLLFKELDPPLYIIKCFSLRHSIHFQLTGLKEWARAKIFEVM